MLYLAAMEPPGEGRYEPRPLDPLFPQDIAAAMEPPGEGRYERERLHKYIELTKGPQWSRPVKGGTR